jgi:hypothetical protein
MQVWNTKSLLILVLVTMLSACLPTNPLPSLPTDTRVPTSTATPTVVWFPATPTNTAIPTTIPTPTPEMRPGVGVLLLRDDFTDADHWLTGNTGKGTIALGLNELSLVLTMPRGYLYSVRDEPILDKFYAEITASPSLCTGMDEYGILVRYNSPVDFYRFSLSCNGQIRLDKLLGGSASSPQPWLVSTSVPTAAPSSSMIGIWVVGSEMRFFVNNEFQFNVIDRSLSSGMFGVFTRSAGETAVTVSFSDLEIYQIQQ